MDPMGALFDTLAEASLVPEDRGRMGFHLDESVTEEGTTPAPPTLELRENVTPIFSKSDDLRPTIHDLFIHMQTRTD